MKECILATCARYTCCFSDFPWPPGAADFPGAGDVAAYLEAYARQFELEQYGSRKPTPKLLDCRRKRV